MNTFLQRVRVARIRADELARKCSKFSICCGRATFIRHYQSEVARALGVSTMAMSTMSRALERDGFLHRQSDDHDRRQVSLVLTGKGLRVLARIERAADPRIL